MTDFNPNSPQAPLQVVEKPTSVTVFGILNIVFGGMGLLMNSVIVFKLVSTMTKEYEKFLFLMSFIGVGFSILLLVLGIGLLMFQRWARGGSVIYACVIIFWNIIGVGVSIAALSMKWISVPEAELPGFIGGTVGGMCGGLIYPVLLLIFMQTAKVKQAFRARGQSA